MRAFVNCVYLGIGMLLGLIIWLAVILVSWSVVIALGLFVLSMLSAVLQPR
jgi:hypothetical protein